MFAQCRAIDSVDSRKRAPNAGAVPNRCATASACPINSFARSGAGVYAGLGAAYAGQQGVPGQGFLAVLVGVEAAPGRRKGWYVELGFCGGLRAALGLRLRKFPPWWGAT